jgi:hypothetical protein
MGKLFNLATAYLLYHMPNMHLGRYEAGAYI